MPKFLISFATLLLAGMVHAQTLHFDEAPSLDGIEMGALDSIEATLRNQVTELESDTGSVEQTAVRAAQRTMRRVIIELAQRAQAESAIQHVIALTALRLNAALGNLDRLLNVLPQSSPFTGTPPDVLTDRNRHRAIAKLQRFAASGLDVLRRSSTASPSDLDNTLATVLAPIVEVMAIIEHQPLTDRWPSDGDVARGFRSAGPNTQLPGSLPPLEGDSPEATLERRLQTAVAFAELSHTAKRLQAALNATRNAGQAVLDAGLDADAATAIDTRRTQAIELARSPRNWPEAIASFGVVAEALRVAEAITNTEELTSRRDVPPHLLHNAWLNAVTVADPSLADMLLKRTLVLIETLGRVPDPSSVPRTLRIPFRAVEARQERLERQLINTLPRIAADPSAMRDPEIAGLLMALTSAEDDLNRIRTAAMNTEDLSHLQPNHKANIARVLRGWCQRLGNDSERSEAAALLDNVSIAVETYIPIAFEEELREATPLSESLTGGRSGDLLRRIESLREAWAQEVGNGEFDGGAGNALARIARLGVLLDELRFITQQTNRLTEVLGTANHWGAWYVPPSALTWSIRSLQPGLKLAATSALEANPDALERDLQRLEVAAPPIRLLAYLAANLETPLAGVLEGPSGTIAAVALPPPPKAWLRAYRSDLAAICRGLIEQNVAQANGDDSLAAELQAFVVAASTALLEELGDLKR